MKKKTTKKFAKKNKPQKARNTKTRDLGADVGSNLKPTEEMLKNTSTIGSEPDLH